MTTTDNGAFYATEPWPWKFWRALGFGRRHIDWPDGEADGYAPGALATDTHVHLDLADRFRVLLTGYIRVDVRTLTDVPVKRAKSFSQVSVPIPEGKKP